MLFFSALSAFFSALDSLAEVVVSVESVFEAEVSLLEGLISVVALDDVLLREVADEGEEVLLLFAAGLSEELDVAELLETLGDVLAVALAEAAGLALALGDEVAVADGVTVARGVTLADAVALGEADIPGDALGLMVALGEPAVAAWPVAGLEEAP